MKKEIYDYYQKKINVSFDVVHCCIMYLFYIFIHSIPDTYVENTQKNYLLSLNKRTKH